MGYYLSKIPHLQSLAYHHHMSAMQFQTTYAVPKHMDHILSLTIIKA